MDAGRDDPKKLFAEAVRLFNAGEVQESLNILNALNDRHPGQRPILFARARCLRQLGDLDDALALCDELLASGTDETVAALKKDVRARIAQGLAGSPDNPFAEWFMTAYRIYAKKADKRGEAPIVLGLLGCILPSLLVGVLAFVMIFFALIDEAFRNNLSLDRLGDYAGAWVGMMMGGALVGVLAGWMFDLLSMRAVIAKSKRGLAALEAAGTTSHTDSLRKVQACLYLLPYPGKLRHLHAFAAILWDEDGARDMDKWAGYWDERAKTMWWPKYLEYAQATLDGFDRASMRAEWSKRLLELGPYSKVREVLCFGVHPFMEKCDGRLEPYDAIREVLVPVRALGQICQDLLSPLEVAMFTDLMANVPLYAAFHLRMWNGAVFESAKTLRQWHEDSLQTDRSKQWNPSSESDSKRLLDEFRLSVSTDLFLWGNQVIPRVDSVQSLNRLCEVCRQGTVGALAFELHFRSALRSFRKGKDPRIMLATLADFSPHAQTILFALGEPLSDHPE